MAARTTLSLTLPVIFCVLHSEPSANEVSSQGQMFGASAASAPIQEDLIDLESLPQPPQSASSDNIQLHLNTLGSCNHTDLDLLKTCAHGDADETLVEDHAGRQQGGFINQQKSSTANEQDHVTLIDDFDTANTGRADLLHTVTDATAIAVDDRYTNSKAVQVCVWKEHLHMNGKRLAARR